MRRLGRYLWRGCIATTLLLAALLVAGWFWLPHHIEQRLAAAFKDAGLGPAAFTIDQLDWQAIVLGSVRLGPGAMIQADRVAVSYRMPGLLAGRVESIRIDNAVVRLEHDGQRWVMPQLATRDGPAADQAPFDLLLANGRVAIILNDQAMHLPARLILQRTTRGVDVDLAFDASEFAADVASLTLNGGIDWPAMTGERLRVQLAPLRVLPGSPLHELGRSLLGVDAVGEVSLSGHLSTDPAGDAQMDVRLSGGELRWPGDHLVIRDLGAQLTVTRVWPLRTAPGGTLRWTTAAIGDIVLEDGQVSVTVNDPGRVRVDEAAWRIGEGRLSTSSFEFDPLAPDIAARVRIENLALERWLELVTMGHVVGEGRLQGEVAVRVAAQPSLRFALGTGELQSVGPGVFSVVDLQATQQLVEERGLIDLAQLDYSAEVQDRIVEALQAFAYDSLRFELRRATSGVAMRLNTQGRGLRGARQQFGSLIVNVTGINDLFDVALRAKLGYDEARAQVDRMLERPDGQDGDGGQP